MDLSGIQSQVEEGVKLCPFLRNMSGGPAQSSLFCVSSPSANGPLFEDGPNFDLAFKLFHGKGGVVPLSSEISELKVEVKGERVTTLPTSAPPSLAFGRLSGLCTASLSLSSFGPFGPFGYLSAMSLQAPQEKQPKETKQEKKQEKDTNANQPASEVHEASGSEWLSSGNCPIAKSYRALSKAIPLVASMIRLPTGIKYQCPPAIVALRAAVAKHPTMRALRPQALPTKVLAIGLVGMFLNMPLGVWREHCEKFSPQWILAVHASVPFVALLRKAALMPKYAMAFTIAASIVGQTIGAKLEKSRIEKAGASRKVRSVKDCCVKENNGGIKYQSLGVHGADVPNSSTVTVSSEKSTVEVDSWNDPSEQTGAQQAEIEMELNKQAMTILLQSAEAFSRMKLPEGLANDQQEQESCNSVEDKQINAHSKAVQECNRQNGLLYSTL